jgi:hypothetical protein
VKRATAVIAFLALVWAGSASASAQISPAERAAINRTLDGFINHALKRQDVDAAWNLVTPDLRTGISRSSWDAGNVPVIPFRAGGTTFHQWTVDSATPTQVDFELIVPAAKTKDSSIQFFGTMEKIRGRWLVDAFNPSATFGGGAVVSGSDYAPPPGGGGTGEATLGSVWIVIPAVLIGAGILFLIGWLLFGWARGRRRRESLRPLDPLVVRRRDSSSEPALVAEERSQADG